MSDTDSDNQERNMDVDKLDFLNSFFSESVPDISPECPIDLFLSPEVNQAIGNSGSDQTMSSAYLKSENNPARNGPLISSGNGVAISKFTGASGSINGDNFGLETPSKLKSTVNHSSGYSSSSLATPELSSGDGQFFKSTPTSNFSCPQDGVQASSKVFCPKNILPAFSLNPMNHSASSSHSEKDLDPSNIMGSGNSVGRSSLDFVQNNVSDNTIRPLNPVASFTFVPSTHSISSSSYKDHPPNLVRVLPPAQLFPKSIPYLDQLDYCFDLQLSPAPGPRQVSSDDQNNNTAVDEVKEAVSLRVLPSGKVSPSPPVAVLLQPRLDQNPQMQNLKPKKLRSLKPSLKVETQESDYYPLKTKDLPHLQSFPESANRPSTTRSSASSVDLSSTTQSIFKTDISSFYSNSAKQVPHALQLGQNTIPLAKKRKNSTEFWNVELFEDGTEDLFIEKPKRFRDRRKKKAVDEKVIKEACDIELFKDGNEDLFIEKPKIFRVCQKKKVIDKKVSKEPCDFEQFEGVTAADLLAEEPKRFRDSQRKRFIDEKVIKTGPDQPGLIKVPSGKLGLLKSIRIASPIVSSKAKGEVNKSASLVKIVKLSKPKKNEEVKSMQVVKVRKCKDVCSTPRPDCAGCVELRLQHKRIKDEDVENNLSDAGGLSNLCEDCGSEICLNTKGDKKSSGDVDLVVVDIIEESIKEMSPNLNDSEDDNEVGKLVMDLEEVSEIASSKESEEEDIPTSGSINVSAVCSSSTPPSLYPAVCWSCKSTRSLGSWHAHKWQHNKFLCSSCFNFYKEKNAKSSRNKTILPRMKKSEQTNQSGTISRVASPSASESLDFLTLTQYSPSLQDLPPGTYDFSAQVETDLASISTQVVPELGQYQHSG